MQIQRIRTAAEWAAQHSTEGHRIVVMVDNTYLGPLLQRPLEEGADLVLYSATKYLGGHSDLIAGGASGGADIVAKVKEFRTFLGGTIDSWTAWMLARSMETLHVRVEHQQRTAGHVLNHLRELCGAENVKSAWSEDLATMGQDVVAAEAQQRGGGAMIGLNVPGGREGRLCLPRRPSGLQIGGEPRIDRKPRRTPRQHDPRRCACRRESPNRHHRRLRKAVHRLGTSRRFGQRPHPSLESRRVCGDLGCVIARHSPSSRMLDFGPGNLGPRPRAPLPRRRPRMAGHGRPRRQRSGPNGQQLEWRHRLHDQSRQHVGRGPHLPRLLDKRAGRGVHAS